MTRCWSSAACRMVSCLRPVRVGRTRRLEEPVLHAQLVAVDEPRRLAASGALRDVVAARVHHHRPGDVLVEQREPLPEGRPVPPGVVDRLHEGDAEEAVAGGRRGLLHRGDAGQRRDAVLQLLLLRGRGTDAAAPPCRWRGAAGRGQRARPRARRQRATARQRRIMTTSRDGSACRATYSAPPTRTLDAVSEAAADVPPEHGAVPGAERAAAGLRGPLPRARAPPAPRRRPRRAGVRVGGHPRGLRGGRPRRAVAVPHRLPGAAHRGRGPRRRHLRRRRRRPGTDPARPPRDRRPVPDRPRGRAARAGRPACPRTCSSRPARCSPPTGWRSPRSGPTPTTGALPRDPSYLSWTLAACAPLPLSDRQALLEADDVVERLVLVTDLLRSELRAMNVIPSLPATEVARTRWSPN